MNVNFRYTSGTHLTRPHFFVVALLAVVINRIICDRVQYIKMSVPAYLYADCWGQNRRPDPLHTLTFTSIRRWPEVYYP